MSNSNQNQPRKSPSRSAEGIIFLTVGALTIALPFCLPNGNYPYLKIFVVCWFGGGALIGSAISSLFGRQVVFGALIGFAVQLGILILFFLLYAMMGPVIG